MNTIRSSNLYVSSQVQRWLKWMAEIESKRDTEYESPDVPVRVTPDSLAEKILREHILSKYPGMDKVEHDYWEARGRLDDMAVKELKGKQ
jgi:hypothetical protein